MKKPLKISTLGPHKNANVQVNLPHELEWKIQDLVKKTIPREELAGDGYENQSHITIKYGVNEDEEVLAGIVSKQPPFTVRLGKIHVFKPSESSDNTAPVVVELLSNELNGLHKIVSEAMGNRADDFEYKPHITLAYVKPEIASKYDNSDLFEGLTFKADSVTLSRKSREQISFPLGSPINIEATSLGRAHKKEGRTTCVCGTRAWRVCNEWGDIDIGLYPKVVNGYKVDYFLCTECGRIIEVVRNYESVEDANFPVIKKLPKEKLYRLLNNLNLFRSVNDGGIKISSQTTHEEKNQCVCPCGGKKWRICDEFGDINGAFNWYSSYYICLKCGRVILEDPKANNERYKYPVVKRVKPPNENQGYLFEKEAGWITKKSGKKIKFKDRVACLYCGTFPIWAMCDSFGYRIPYHDSKVCFFTCSNCNAVIKVNDYKPDQANIAELVKPGTKQILLPLKESSKVKIKNQCLYCPYCGTTSPKWGDCDRTGLPVSYLSSYDNLPINEKQQSYRFLKCEECLGVIQVNGDCTMATLIKPGNGQLLLSLKESSHKVTPLSDTTYNNGEMGQETNAYANIPERVEGTEELPSLEELSPDMFKSAAKEVSKDGYCLCGNTRWGKSWDSNLSRSFSYPSYTPCLNCGRVYELNINQIHNFRVVNRISPGQLHLPFGKNSSKKYIIGGTCICGNTDWRDTDCTEDGIPCEWDHVIPYNLLCKCGRIIRHGGEKWEEKHLIVKRINPNQGILPFKESAEKTKRIGGICTCPCGSAYWRDCDRNGVEEASLWLDKVSYPYYGQCRSCGRIIEVRNPEEKKYRVVKRIDPRQISLPLGKNSAKTTGHGERQCICGERDWELCDRAGFEIDILDELPAYCKCKKCGVIIEIDDEKQINKFKIVKKLNPDQIPLKFSSKVKLNNNGNLNCLCGERGNWVICDKSGFDYPSNPFFPFPHYYRCSSCGIVIQVDRVDQKTNFKVVKKVNYGQRNLPFKESAKKERATFREGRLICPCGVWNWTPCLDKHGTPGCREYSPWFLKCRSCGRITVREGDDDEYCLIINRINTDQLMLPLQASTDSIAEKIRKQIEGAGEGRECHLVAEQIENKLGLKQISGFYLSDSFKDGHGDHSWNEMKDGTIVDATHIQFGNPDIAIVPKTSPEYKNYHGYCGDYACPHCTCKKCNPSFHEEAMKSKKGSERTSPGLIGSECPCETLSSWSFCDKYGNKPTDESMATFPNYWLCNNCGRVAMKRYKGDYKMKIVHRINLDQGHLFNVRSSPDFGYTEYNEEQESKIKDLVWETGDWGLNGFDIVASEGEMEVGSIRCSLHQSTYSVDESKISTKWKGTGLGQLLYDKAIEEAKTRGSDKFESDSVLTDDAHSAWARLAKRYPVIANGTTYSINLDMLPPKTSSFSKTADWIEARNARVGNWLVGYGPTFIIENVMTQGDEIVIVGKGGVSRRFSPDEIISVGMRKKASDEDFEIKEPELLASHNKQKDLVIYATEDSIVCGKLEYTVFGNTISISSFEVLPKYKSTDLGRLLWEKMKETNPKKEIIPGYPRGPLFKRTASPIKGTASPDGDNTPHGLYKVLKTDPFFAEREKLKAEPTAKKERPTKPVKPSNKLRSLLQKPL